jgi:ABC-type polysaccharide/polyol phosphate transport system ATPase subunit
MYAIEINDVSKIFRLYKNKNSTLKERIITLNRNNYQEYKALYKISLNVNKGETIALLGRNGSGKSTLLKLISRILYPDSGQIKVNGRISSLLELGAGFHPDFTGRENIFMNASILGLSKKEINEKLESIIKFSELEDYIDTPVKTYSSGMYMRLAFSVAISVEPEILLIDEVLAVGDNAFQNKCINKLKELKGKGTTIVIVTHDNSMVEKLCDRAAWLENGKLVDTGSPKEIVMKYLDRVARQENERLMNEEQPNNELEPESDNNENVNPQRWGNNKINIVNVKFYDYEGNEKKVFQTNEYMEIKIEYKVNQNFDNVVFGIGIYSKDNICCYGTNTDIDHQKYKSLPKNGYMSFVIENLNLLSGEYLLDIAIHKDDGEPYDYISKTIYFQVISNLPEIGIARQTHNWKLTDKANVHVLNGLEG